MLDKYYFNNQLNNFNNINNPSIFNIEYKDLVSEYNINKESFKRFINYFELYSKFKVVNDYINYS